MSNSLKIPIYLDHQSLFDLLGSIQNGFSAMEKVTTETTNNKSNEFSGEADAGAKGLLDFFKLNLKFKGSKSGAKGEKETIQEEKIHTYGSLFNKFRDSLIEQDLVKCINNKDDWNNLEAGHFIEIQGTFTPNPLTESLQTLSRVIDLTGLFQKEGMFDDSWTIKTTKEIGSINKILKGILEQSQAEHMKTYIINAALHNDEKVVVTLFQNYLRDLSGTNLPQGKYTILGKVSHKVGKTTSISLLRGSAFSGLSDGLINQMFSGFMDMNQEGFNIPEIVTEINGPALQLIPISVYI